MRHAKSDWSQEGQADKDRSLNARGRLAAPRMGDWIVANKVVPNLVLCSTAVRTRETLALLQKRWNLTVESAASQPQVEFVDELYLATANTILSIASNWTERTSILVLGHNPGMEDLASYLGQRQIEMPTAAIAMLEAIDERWPADWRDVNSWAWRGLVKPRDLAKDLE